LAYLALAASVTRLGEFSPIGWLFNLFSVLKIAEVVNIFGLRFQRFNLYINFGKKRVGRHFGRFFHKLIWPPCLQQRNGRWWLFEGGGDGSWNCVFPSHGVWPDMFSK
jgi:hypothetical protein